MADQLYFIFSQKFLRIPFFAAPTIHDTVFSKRIHSLGCLLVIKGDAMAPRTSQPIAARGGSVQPLMLTLLTLRATIEAMPPPSKQRVFLSTCLQLHQACHKAKSKRARNTTRTGRPAIAPNSRYELCVCAKGTS